MMSTNNIKNSIEKKALFPMYHFVTSANFIASILVIAIVIALIFANQAFGEPSSTAAYVKHRYTEFNGNQYAYGFKICAGNLDLHNAQVLVSSDSQTIPVNSENIINAGTCSKTFVVQIYADDPDRISATLIDNTYV